MTGHIRLYHEAETPSANPKALPVDPFDACPLDVGRSLDTGDRVSEAGYGAVLEDQPKLDRFAKPLADPRDRASCEERVAPERKEVVVSAHSLHGSELPEHLGDDLLFECRRRLVHVRCVRGHRLSVGQAFVVDLAVSEAGRLGSSTRCVGMSWLGRLDLRCARSSSGSVRSPTV